MTAASVDVISDHLRKGMTAAFFHSSFPCIKPKRRPVYLDKTKNRDLAAVAASAHSWAPFFLPFPCCPPCFFLWSLIVPHVCPHHGELEEDQNVRCGDHQQKDQRSRHGNTVGGMSFSSQQFGMCRMFYTESYLGINFNSTHGYECLDVYQQ